ncbi:MAG: glycosyltransferase [Acidimicrobiaceae bacterium]|nr:glycosyltransferase [Acidimicrobiaceae bacterium]
MTHAVAIVPAFNRADTVGATVTALATVPDVLDVIVVDDGSRDRTAAAAAAAGARVVELARNRGKGAAITAGIAASGAPDAYLLIDADLGDSAALAGDLLQPVALGMADMTIAVLGSPERGGGFGFVKRFAARVLRSETGMSLAAPLSGQRAVRGSLLRSLHLAPGFGLEIGLTLDAANRGASIREVEVGFTHRQTGRDLSGFAHRARIGRHVYLAALPRVGGPQLIYYLIASVLSRVVSTARPGPLRDRRRLLGRTARQSWQRARQVRPPRSIRDLRPWRSLRRLRILPEGQGRRPTSES